MASLSSSALLVYFSIFSKICRCCKISLNIVVRQRSTGFNLLSYLRAHFRFQIFHLTMLKIVLPNVFMTRSGVMKPKKKRSSVITIPGDKSSIIGTIPAHMMFKLRHPISRCSRSSSDSTSCSSVLKAFAVCWLFSV